MNALINNNGYYVIPRPYFPTCPKTRHSMSRSPQKCFYIFCLLFEVATTAPALVAKKWRSDNHWHRVVERCFVICDDLLHHLVEGGAGWV